MASSLALLPCCSAHRPRSINWFPLVEGGPVVELVITVGEISGFCYWGVGGVPGGARGEGFSMAQGFRV